MHVVEGTAIIVTERTVYTAETVEGVRSPGDQIDKVILHHIGQILSQMYAIREETVKEWAYYLEVRPLGEMEKAREAFIKWRMNAPKRSPLDWKHERTQSGREGLTNG